MDRRALLMPAAVVLLMVAGTRPAVARPAPAVMTPIAAAAPASLTTQPGPTHDWGGRWRANTTNRLDATTFGDELARVLLGISDEEIVVRAEVEAEFGFRVDDSGAIAGNGALRVTPLGGGSESCRITERQDPAAFPITITGRRMGDSFALTIIATASVTKTRTFDCDVPLLVVPSWELVQLLGQNVHVFEPASQYHDATDERVLNFTVAARDGGRAEATAIVDGRTIVMEATIYQVPWEGTWHATGETFLPPGGGRFARIREMVDGTYTFTVAPDNTLRGEATATVAYELESGEYCTSRASLPPTMVALEVRGRRAGEQFELELRPRAGVVLRYSEVNRCPPDAPPETRDVNWLDAASFGLISHATMPARDGAEIAPTVIATAEVTVRYRVTLTQQRR